MLRIFLDVTVRGIFSSIFFILRIFWNVTVRGIFFFNFCRGKPDRTKHNGNKILSGWFITKHSFPVASLSLCDSVEFIFSFQYHPLFFSTVVMFRTFLIWNLFLFLQQLIIPLIFSPFEQLHLLHEQSGLAAQRGFFRNIVSCESCCFHMMSDRKNAPFLSCLKLYPKNKMFFSNHCNLKLIPILSRWCIVLSSSRKS